MENITEQKSGFLLIDKIIGPTSFNLVHQLRIITDIKKIGHAGTLDPFASGLMILAIGRKATKEISKYVKLDKSYLATLQLGATSTTHDPEGEITINDIKKEVTLEEIQNTVAKFVGEIEQIPPMHSAKKIGGQKLYRLARKGKTVERYPSDVTVHKIEIKKYAWPELELDIHCSSGTYIRALARDIGKDLELGAYLKSLRRTTIGSFDISYACLMEEVDGENWEGKLFEIK